MNIIRFILLISLATYGYGCILKSNFDPIKYEILNKQYKIDQTDLIARNIAKKSISDTYICLSKNLYASKDEIQDCEEYLTYEDRYYRGLKLQNKIKFSTDSLYKNNGTDYKLISTFIFFCTIFLYYLNSKNKNTDVINDEKLNLIIFNEEHMDDIFKHQKYIEDLKKR